MWLWSIHLCFIHYWNIWWKRLLSGDRLQSFSPLKPCHSTIDHKLTLIFLAQRSYLKIQSTTDARYFHSIVTLKSVTKFKLKSILSLFNLLFRIQEEREERYKRKKGDSGGLYPDLDLPMTRRSSNSDKRTPHVSLYKPSGSLKPFFVFYLQYLMMILQCQTQQTCTSAASTPRWEETTAFCLLTGHMVTLTDCITVTRWRSCNYTGVLYLCTKLLLSLDDRGDAL